MIPDPSEADTLFFHWAGKLGTQGNMGPFVASYFIAHKQRLLEFQQAAGMVEVAKAIRAAIADDHPERKTAVDAVVTQFQHLAEQREAAMASSHNNTCKMIRRAIEQLAD